MANRQQEPTKDLADVLPVTAMAMLQQGAGGANERAQALLTDLLTDVMAERKAKKDRAEKLRMNSIKIAQEDAKRRSAEKAMCSHRDQVGGSRLRGQFLSGTGQLCLVCMFCSDEFHNPPMGPDQKAAPKELIPSRDVIGG